RGPEVILAGVKAIPIQPNTLPALPEAPSFQKVVVGGWVPLVHELKGRPVQAAPGTVGVRLTRSPRQEVYELAGVPVKFLCPTDSPSRPRFGDGRGGKIAVRVKGRAVAGPPAVAAYIDLTRPGFRADAYTGETVCLQLPEGYHLDQEPPI